MPNKENVLQNDKSLLYKKVDFSKNISNKLKRSLVKNDTFNFLNCWGNKAFEENI